MNLINYNYYILGILVFFLLIFLLNSIDNFNNTSSHIACNSIPKGGCTSDLCPNHCKINHTDDDSNVCYCVERK
jgi:hypothetical protein